MRAFKNTRNHGFTIVELLIVIVVIGILAAITIVAYNGITNKAQIASLQSELSSAAKKLEVYKFSTSISEQYPADLTTAGITSSSSLTYFPNGSSYCLTGINGNNSYYVTNTSNKAQAGACAVTDQIVGWWQLDNNATDASGNSITGSINGVNPTIGQDGQANSAYQFNGTSSYIALPSNAALNTTNNYSISAWIKLDAWNSVAGWNDIISGNGADWSLGINTNSGGNGYLMLTKVNVADAPTSTTPVSRQAWRHVVMTYSNNTVRYYLDSQPIGVVTASSNFNTLTSSAKRIGGRSSGGGFFNGAIDDVRVYNKVLSANEILLIYSGGAQ